MDGIINLYKPRGMRSREAVNTVQERLGGVKAGHGGTLDALAEGVLPVLIGQATRIFEYLLEQKKTYRVQARLDLHSPTLDRDGQLEKITVETVPSIRKIKKIVDQFQGEIEQRPPKFSAVKHKGKRAHKRARSGEKIKLPPREVYCGRIEIRNYDFPELQLEVTCGRGFYIRSLIRDICDELNIEGGVVEKLIREEYAGLSVQEAIVPEEAGEENLLPIERGLSHITGRKLSEEEIRLVTHGTWIQRQPENKGKLLAFDQAGELRAILKATDKRKKEEWKPEVVFKK